MSEPHRHRRGLRQSSTLLYGMASGRKPCHLLDVSRKNLVYGFLATIGAVELPKGAAVAREHRSATGLRDSDSSRATIMNTALTAMAVARLGSERHSFPARAPPLVTGAAVITCCTRWDLVLLPVTHWHVPMLALEVAVGCAAHIAGDELAHGGCPLLWPVSGHGFYLAPRPLQITAAKIGENWGASRCWYWRCSSPSGAPPATRCDRVSGCPNARTCDADDHGGDV